MPIARYFAVVGTALAAVLLITSWSLPESPASFPDRPEIIERAAIRIRSDRKWPEKIVLDTTQPTMPPSSAEIAPTEQLVERVTDEVMDQRSVNLLTKQNLDARTIDVRRPFARAKRGAATAVRSPHVARTRHRNKLATLGPSEACCRFEWAGRPVMSNPVSRKRVARQDSWIGWHFPESN